MEELIKFEERLNNIESIYQDLACRIVLFDQQVNQVVKQKRKKIQDTSTDFNHTPKRRSVKRNLTTQTKELLLNALQAHYLFSSLSAQSTDALMDFMTKWVYQEGECVVKQGTKGDTFYIIESGTFDVIIDGNKVATLEKGGSFGELALMYNSPRAATIRVTSPSCDLWEVDRKTFRSLLASHISEESCARMEFLKSVPILSSLNDLELSKLSKALELCYFAKGVEIITEGELGDTFYIIKEGSVKCFHHNDASDQQSAILRTGDYFGEVALLDNTSRTASVVALESVTCFTMQRENFNKILGSLKDILGRNAAERVLRTTIFSSLDDRELHKIAEKMEIAKYDDGEYVVRQTEKGRNFFVIYFGEATVIQNGVCIAHLKAGDSFGEHSLLNIDQNEGDIIANGTLRCAVLDHTTYQEIKEQLDNNRIDIPEKPHESCDSSHPPPTTTTSVATEKLKLNSLEIYQTIGKGAFGYVKLAKEKKTARMIALKCLQKAIIVDTNQEKNVLQEKEIMMAARHPFIPRIYGTCSDADQLYIALELVTGGEMWGLLYEKDEAIARNRYGGFHMEAEAFYISSIVSIFKHLHEDLGVVYRDLKPENILIDHEGYVKLVDFGFAKHLPVTDGISLSDRTFTLCGTPEYIAPEILLGTGHNQSADLWALGILAYELAYKRTPFEDDDETMIFRKIIKSEDFLMFPSKDNIVLNDLIKKLLHPNPSFRLGALKDGISGILNHEWFQQCNIDSALILQRKVEVS